MKKSFNILDYDYFIFDMDGTLIDSMPLWYKRGKEAVEKTFNIKLEYSNLEELRFKVRDILDNSNKQTSTAVYDLWNSLMNEEYFNSKPKEGVIEFLELLKRLNKHCCVATATEVDLAKSVLEKAGLLSYFDFVYSTSVFNFVSKTRPDIFIKCTQKLGCFYDECVIFEDIYKFVEEPTKLGFCTIGVYDEVHLSDETLFRKNAKGYIKSFKELLSERQI